jgi:hypothetical protein
LPSVELATPDAPRPVRTSCAKRGLSSMSAMGSATHVAARRST